MSGDEGGEVLAPTSNIEGAQKRTRCQNGGCGREAVMGSCCLMGTVSVLQEKSARDWLHDNGNLLN